MKFLLVVILLALATYATIRIIQRRGVLPQPKPTQRRPPVRPFGPDDDDDFLRTIDRERKRKHPEDPEERPATGTGSG